MKDVVIDNRKGLVMVNGKVISRILLHMMRGAVGKSFVVKRYRGGRMVVTHFPDMSGIVATGKQKARRDLFREAVVWAKWVIADEQRKLAFKRTLPRKKRRKVYQAALQLYIRMKGNKQWLRKVLENMERQWAVLSVKCELGVEREISNVKGSDIRKQLAVKAVMENSRFEQEIRVKGIFEQMEPWRVMWRRRHREAKILKWADLFPDYSRYQRLTLPGAAII